LEEEGSLGPEPFVFVTEAVTVVQDELQPVIQFPVFDPALVQLVPKVLQVSLFSHARPAGRFAVRYHAPEFPLVHHRHHRLVRFSCLRLRFVGAGAGSDGFGGEEVVGVVLPGGEVDREGGEWVAHEGVGGREGGEHGCGGRVTGFFETRGGGGEEGEREEKRCRTPLFMDHLTGANAVILRGFRGSYVWSETVFCTLHGF